MNIQNNTNHNIFLRFLAKVILSGKKSIVYDLMFFPVFQNNSESRKGKSKGFTFMNTSYSGPSLRFV